MLKMRCSGCNEETECPRWILGDPLEVFTFEPDPEEAYPYCAKCVEKMGIEDDE